MNAATKVERGSTKPNCRASVGLKASGVGLGLGVRRLTAIRVVRFCGRTFTTLDAKP